MSKKNIASVHAIADYFLLKIEADAGESITNLKLQKIVYYAQAWTLAIYGRPLFAEEIEAWANGPVCPKLYRRFRKYGWQSVDPTDRKTKSLQEIDEEEQELLDEIWHKYTRLSSSELIALTHSEEPWQKTYGNLPPGSRCNEVITHDVMQDFYQQQLTEQKTTS